MTEHIEVAGGGAPISLFVSPKVVRVEPTTTLRGAAETMTTNGVGAVVVGHGHSVVGIVSERDVVRAVADGRDLGTVTVAEVASTDLLWCDRHATVGEVAERMLEHYVRHLVVGRPDHLVGIVSARDVLGAYAS